MTTISTSRKIAAFVVVAMLWTSLLYAAHSQPRKTKTAAVKPTGTSTRTPINGVTSSATGVVLGSAAIADPLGSSTNSGPVPLPGGEVNIEVPAPGGGEIPINQDPGVDNPPVTPTVDLTPIVWEAEDTTGIKQEYLAFKIMKKVLPKNDDGSGAVSKNRWLVVDPKNDPADKIVPDTAPYWINIPQAGTYYLWARTYWDSGCGNTFFVNIEGINKSSDEAFVLGGDATYDGLHWVCLMNGKNMRPLQLGAGMVNINLRVREAGTAVDQFLLTQDKGFIPDDVQ